MPNENKVMCHQSTSLVVDGNNPDIPVTQCKMGQIAPNFQAHTTDGDIDFHEWLGDSWGVLFSHPAPFTPICTTEMGSMARHYKKFQRRDVKLLGVSCDNIIHLEDWIMDIKAFYRLDSFNITLMADESRKVAFQYGIIDSSYRNQEHGMPYPCRGLFIIDPHKIVRMMSFHPWSMGRSTKELLRTIDSLQLTQKFEHKVCTPADWEVNNIPMVDGSVSPEDINRLFRTGVVTYMMPSGQNYMRTIGKQTVEASTEDKKDNDSYENEETNLEYVHNFGARIPIKHGANIDSGCSTPLGEMLNCKNRC